MEKTMHTASVGRHLGILTIESGTARFESKGFSGYVPLRANWVSIVEGLGVLTRDETELVTLVGRNGHVVRTTIGAMGPLNRLGLDVYEHGVKVL